MFASFRILVASSLACYSFAHAQEPQRLYPPGALATAGETQEDVAEQVNGNGLSVRAPAELVNKHREILVPQTKETSCVIAVIHSCLRSSGIKLKQEELLESEIARWNLWMGMPMEVIPKYLEHALGHSLSMEKLSAMQPSVWNQATASKFLTEAKRRLDESQFAFVSIQVGPLKRHALRLLEISDDGDLVILNPQYGPTFDANEDAVDKNLLLQKWPSRWLRQPLMADLYFVKAGGMATISTSSQVWATPPSNIKTKFSSPDFLVRPGGVPHAYVAKAILRDDHIERSIDQIMAAPAVPSKDSGWNWFYYLAEVLSDASGKKYSRDYGSEMKSSSYSGSQGDSKLLRDLRDRMKKNDHCAIELKSGDGERVALLLGMDSSKKVLHVLVPEEDKGQDSSTVLQEWAVDKLLAANVYFNFYTKRK